MIPALVVSNHWSFCERARKVPGVDWNNIISFCNCQALMLGISFFFGVLYVLFIDVEFEAKMYTINLSRGGWMCKLQIPSFLSSRIQGCQTASNAMLSSGHSSSFSFLGEGSETCLSVASVDYFRTQRSFSTIHIFVAIKFILLVSCMKERREKGIIK